MVSASTRSTCVRRWHRGSLYSLLEYTDWINVSGNPLINAQDSASALIYGGVTTLKSLNFRTTFDVFATPKVFLLDKNKKIIGKQIGAEQMGDILGRLEEMERKGIPY